MEKAGPRDNADKTATGAAESEIKVEANREARSSMTHQQSHHTGQKKLLISLSGSFSSLNQNFTEFSLKMFSPAFQAACSFSCIVIPNLKLNLNQCQL